jgi:amidase
MTDPIGAYVPHGKFTIDGNPSAKKNPLKGLNFAAKDIIDVAGHVTGCGNPDWFKTHSPADTTARCVRDLLDAGANLVGKTVTEELATGLTGENIHYGTPLNVNAPGRVSGGSSSGSAAAVAAGLVDFALGSDTGGSVRAPASFCGLYGLRPSHGRVSLESVMKLAPSFDTIGWFARSPELLRDVARVLFKKYNNSSAPGQFLVASDIMNIVPEPIRVALMHSVLKVAKLLGPAESIGVSNAEGIPDLQSWVSTTRSIWGGESWEVHGDWIKKVKPTFGSGVASRFKARSNVTPDELAVARIHRDAIADHLRELLINGNIIALPSSPGIAPVVGGNDSDIDPFRECNEPIGCISGLGRLPQITIPMAVVDGFPLGLGLAAASGNDEMLLDVAVTLAESGISPYVSIPSGKGS